MKRTDSHALVQKLVRDYAVGREFLAEIAPMIDEITNGEFSDHERKYLFQLVEDAFRRQAEIEHSQEVSHLTAGHLSRQILEKQDRFESVAFPGRMDDGANRISPGRSPFDDFQSGFGPLQN